MIEVWQNEAEKFFKNQTTFQNLRSDYSEKSSPSLRSRAHSQDKFAVLNQTLQNNFLIKNSSLNMQHAPSIGRGMSYASSNLVMASGEAYGADEIFVNKDLFSTVNSKETKQVSFLNEKAADDQHSTAQSSKPKSSLFMQNTLN